MTAHRRGVLAAALLAVALPARLAAADEHERRLSIRGQAALVELDAFATRDSTEVAGGGLSLGWGLRHWLELGVDGVYYARPNATLASARVGVHEGIIYTDLHAAELAGHARLALYAGPFYRIRPVASVRAGLGARLLADPRLFLPGPPPRFVLAAEPDLALFPFVGGDAGVSWRISDDLGLAAVATASLAFSHRAVGVRLELSWFCFDLL